MVAQSIAAPRTHRLPALPWAVLRRAVKPLFFAVLISPIVAGVIVFATSTLPTFMGYGTLVVSSASMAPAINSGDAIIVQPAPDIESIQPGDVITYQPVDAAFPTTHRVVAVTEINGEKHFQTKGDANGTVDANLVPADSVLAEVLIKVPSAGYLLHYAGTPWGKVILFGAPALLLMAWEFSKLRKLARKLREDGPEGMSGEAKAAVQ